MSPSTPSDESPPLSSRASASPDSLAEQRPSHVDVTAPDVHDNDANDDSRAHDGRDVAHGLNTDEHNDNMEPTSHTVSEAPEKALDDFDWTAFEARYHAMIEEADNTENNLNVEFNALVKARLATQLPY